MSKLSFRARALDASKPMPIYMAEELPDLPDYSAINRAVPQMPSGMQKEEECEHHLQRAICTGLIIPTPEVTSLTDVETYDKIYPADYKLPRQLIHMQPFSMEPDIPDYDMDSEDEKWVGAQSNKMELKPLKFEEMMDRLEKSSGQTVVTLNEAKLLLKEDDDLIIAVFDYWLNKRLKTQHPLLLTVKTEHRLGSAANNPYLAFRRRTEKMQTRKNRKNDETSYEKMLKLRRDLSRAVTLLEMVKRREKTKRELLHLTIEVYEKRYQAQDFNGQILADVAALKASRPAFAPLFSNQLGVHQNWTNKICGKDETVPRKEKRQYKKRKHKIDIRSEGFEDGNIHSGTGGSENRGSRIVCGSRLDLLNSSDEDDSLVSHLQHSNFSDHDDDDIPKESQFAFHRNRNNSYLPPITGGFGNWPWCDRNEGGLADKKFRFSLTSISKPTPKSIGLARRRMGRGGRVILDRYSNSMDDIWSSLDFTIQESKCGISVKKNSSSSIVKKEWLHFRPKTPPISEQSRSEESSDSEVDIMSNSRLKPISYPFPSEAESICVDIESDQLDEESAFTSEFNISDYFPVDSFSEFNVTLTADNSSANLYNKDNWPTEELGCSRFLVLPDVENLFTSHIRSQCYNDNIIMQNFSNTSILYKNNLLNSSCSTSMLCTNNIEGKNHKQLPNSNNSCSILLNPGINSMNMKNCKLDKTDLLNTLVISNKNDPHQNNQNPLNVSNCSLITNQSLVPQINHQISQKYSQSNLLPNFKITNLIKQQQQIPMQTQQIQTSGEVTLNNNR